MKNKKSSATLSLQVANPYGIVCFEDLTAEMQKQYDVEKNAKNKAYTFILSKGLLEDFFFWSGGKDFVIPSDDCLRQLELFVTHEN